MSFSSGLILTHSQFGFTPTWAMSRLPELSCSSEKFSAGPKQMSFTSVVQ